MKLLKIEFENVNSFAGRWEIDFTAPAFVREGLFAIVGSTGAGKTSILDAVSLAFYGRTARQEKATNEEIAEVMTQGTYSCVCKASFRGVDGKAYRSEWKITRKRRKGSDGGVNPPEFRLYELDPEKDVTPAKKGETGPLIVQKVGLSFAQFQRSMMLAQGQFDRFLTADDNDRAAILEQAAGTDVFTRIGMRIFSKFQAAKQEVHDIRQRQDDNVPLAPEARAELEVSAAAASARAKEAGEQLKKLQAEQAWLQEGERLVREKTALEVRRNAVAEHLEAFEPDKKILAAAERARTLLVQHTQLEGLRKAQDSASRDVLAREREVLAAEQERVALDESVKELEKCALAARNERDAAAPLLAQAAELDKSILRARGVVAEARTRHDAARKEKFRLEREAKGVAESLGRLEAERSHLEAEREKVRLRSISTDVVAAEEKAKADLAAREEEFARAEAVYKAEQPQIAARIKDAERVRSVMCAMNYDEVRAKLRAGDVCPVCGARIDEEWGARNIPEASEFERAYDEAMAAKVASEAAYSAARVGLNKAWHAADEATRKRKKETEELERLARSLADRETHVKAEIGLHTERREALKAEMEKADASELECGAALKKAQDEFAAHVGRRMGMNLPEDPVAYGKKLDGAVEAAAQALSEGRQKAAAAKGRTAQTSHALEEARVRAQAAAESRSSAAAAFAEAIAGKGFPDEAAWAAACGEDGLLSRIRAKKDELEDEEAALKEAQVKFEQDAAKHAEGEESERSREEVAADMESKEKERSAAEQEAGMSAAQIKADDICRQKAARLDKERQEAESRMASWKALNDMLGGEGGVRFRQYAQGLTLRALLKAANPFLMHMTGGRYSLLWRPAQAKDDGGDASGERRTRKKTVLLPMIVDHDQHDTVRTVSNVSGGERFEVSLALALGLSRLTAGRVKVETMFLDEGFGTLDSERLGAALDVLCSLHREGTMIGVISHVKAVEERLPLRIRVEAAGSGHGRLRGEGPIEGAVREKDE